MDISVNEFGQTEIRISKEEWEEYGKQAGYFGDNIKEASNETPQETPTQETTELKEASEQSEVEALKAEVQELKQTIASMNPNGGINTPILVTDKTAFNEENYPHLFALQNQEGLIGPFKPRP